MNLLTLFGSIFLIWQVAAIWQIKNISLISAIKTNNAFFYRINNILSIVSYAALISIKLWSNNNSVILNPFLLSAICFSQVAFCYLLLKYKAILSDLNDLTNSNLPLLQKQKIFQNIYEKIHKILLSMLSSYLNNNSKPSQNNQQELNYQAGLVTYLADKIENIIKELDLHNQIKFSVERKNLEQQLLRQKGDSVNTIP